jgi:PilZ domain-containing protein
MSSEGDRRAQGALRIPFEALVDVGGALGPSFEAQAVNISEEGMHLRTAYLPDEGQPLTCRFDAGNGQSVLAPGQVVWTERGDKGGEFGIRFTDLDPESAEAIRKMTGVAAEPAAQPTGTKVRLHIEGLASPMRARVKDARPTAVTVGSELGFLQVGKELELEDTSTGGRRPARIDRVDVEIDGDSNVPHLVVTLKYADEPAADGENDAHEAPVKVEHDARPELAAAPAAARAGDLESMEKATEQMKGAFARGVAKVGPGFAKVVKTAKTTIALLAARRQAIGGGEPPPRRTTAPAPGGALRATGRRVVRGESLTGAATEEATMEPKFKLTKRKLALAGAVGLTAVLGAVALHKSHAPSPTAGAEASTAETVSPATTSKAGPLGASPALPMTPARPAQTSASDPLANNYPPPAPPPVTTAPMGDEPGFGSIGGDDSAGKNGKKKHVKVTPFGNGPVAHGNVLHVKMDGTIEKIEGAQQPTGFTVRVPGHRSLEAAGPLAQRDSRIAAIRVSNDPSGAELAVTFKDGVPNYQVRAKGDMLEIALAPIGKTVAKKDTHGQKHHATASAKKHGGKGGDKHPSP